MTANQSNVVHMNSRGVSGGTSSTYPPQPPGGGSDETWKNSVEGRLEKLDQRVHEVYKLMGILFFVGMGALISSHLMLQSDIGKLDARMDILERKMDLLLHHFDIKQNTE